MTFDSEVLETLGNRPPLQRGVWSAANAEFDRKYFGLMPKDSDDRILKYLKWQQSHRGQSIDLGQPVAEGMVQHEAA